MKKKSVKKTVSKVTKQSVNVQETSKKAEEKLTKEMEKEQAEDKMRSVLETFSESAVDMDPYQERFNRHVEELRWLYMELYNNDYMFDDLCKNMYGYNDYVIMSGRVYTRNLSFVEDMFVKYDPQVKGDYEAAPFSMYESNDPFFYDQKGKRFIYDDYGKMISVESASGAFNPAAMEATMVYGVAFEDNVRAVMEDADGHHFVIAAQKRVEYDDDFYNSYIRVIPIRKVDLNQTDIGEATCFAVSSKDIDFLYYGYQNKIVCMSTVTGNVLATYDGFEEGNKIDYIEFDRSENPNRLYVGVSNGSGKAKSG